MSSSAESGNLTIGVTTATKSLLEAPSRMFFTGTFLTSSRGMLRRPAIKMLSYQPELSRQLQPHHRQRWPNEPSQRTGISGHRTPQQRTPHTKGNSPIQYR